MIYLYRFFDPSQVPQEHIFSLCFFFEQLGYGSKKTNKNGKEPECRSGEQVAT